MIPRLEHANLCVSDLDAMVRFIQTAMPEFEIRHQGVDEAGARWLHIGTEQSYLALQEATAPATQKPAPYSGRPGTNHLAFEVADADAVHARMLAAGYQDSTVANAHPHRRRVYFYDSEGNDWEFIHYHSRQPEERNDYTLPQG